MNMIRSKLREKNGMSILLGLMFLLVCMMVGTVVLTASTAAAGKMSGQQKSEQDYLTVASAAQLVKDRICKLTYTYKTGDGSDADFGGRLESSDGEKVILESELKELCETLVEKPADGPVTPVVSESTKRSFEISCSSGADGAGSSDVELDTVYGSLDMKEDGRIIVELWLQDSNEADKNNHNYMTIEFCPDGPVTETTVKNEEDPSGGGVVTSTVTTKTLRWPESGCTITKGKQ